MSMETVHPASAGAEGDRGSSGRPELCQRSAYSHLKPAATHEDDAPKDDPGQE